MPQKEKIQWYANIRRFRDKSGRFISERRVEGYIDRTARNFSVHVKRTAKDLLEDFDTDKFSRWAATTRKQIKDMHTAFTVVALGGKQAATRFSTENGQVWQMADTAIGNQMRFFDNFVSGVITGSTKLDGRFASRAASYAVAGYSTYENAVRIREIRSGAVNEEIRILQSGNSCESCVTASSVGWVAIGSLPYIGNTECGSNCRCRFKYRYNKDKDNGKTS